MVKQFISAPAIAGRVAELGKELSGFYRGKPLTVVMLLNGGICFAADLIRQIGLPMWVDALAVSSYDGKSSTGTIQFRTELKLPVRDRHILLLDDVLDSGVTLKKVMERLQSLNPASIAVCVLLDKAECRKPEGLQRADWSGFCIPAHFVVGYGLDCDEEYRNLPYIGIVE